MPDPREMAPRQKALIMVAIMLGLFLAALDQTIVGTALPRIVTDLAGNNLYTWVVTVYLLASTVSVPVYGKLSDVYGRRPLLLIGVSLFLLGSALSGLSQSMGELIIFRGIQGLGAGAIFPIALAVIGDLFSPAERGRYQGLFGAVFGLSFIIGPLAGGYLTDNLSWHWIFYVNLPIGIAALAVIATQLPNTGNTRGVRVRDLDYLGIAVFSAAAVSLLLGLTNKGLTDSSGQLYSWSSPNVLLFLVGAAVLTAAFVVAERISKEPIIPLDLFRNRTYTTINIATFLVAFGFFSAIIFLPRYFQAVQGLSATASGYRTWPLMLGLILSSTLSGILVSRTGKYKRMLLGAGVVLTVGMFLMTRLQVDTGYWTLSLWMAIAGLGVGPTFSVTTVALQNAVPIRRIGVATSNLTFFRQIGGSVGLAIAGSIFALTFATQLPTQLASHGVPAAVVNQFAQGSGAATNSLTGVGGLGGQLGQQFSAQPKVLASIVAGVQSDLSVSIAGLMWLAAGAAFGALLMLLLMPELPLRRTTTAQEEAAAGRPVVAVA
ncbi:MAG: MFS transporter [Candidatus Dormibacteraeota bacterium]|uniref:MFS transporter n=1 Tax=Candidatus Amunia macphersoniae TaxID=3127014 RepID=A0A934KJQ9_9BACT|nr:MFS transporter [Candidatus Dormibacteraeota bacterium]